MKQLNFEFMDEILIQELAKNKDGYEKLSQVMSGYIRDKLEIERIVRFKTAIQQISEEDLVRYIKENK